MTDVYQNRGAESAPIANLPSSASLQWTHRILRNPFFKSPWQAGEDAMDLAMEVAPLSLVEPESKLWGFTSLNPPARTTAFKKVSFSEQALLWTGLEDEWNWTFHTVPVVDVSLREENAIPCFSLQSLSAALSDAHERHFTRRHSFAKFDMIQDPHARVEPDQVQAPVSSFLHGAQFGGHRDHAWTEAFCSLNPGLPYFEGHASYHEPHPRSLFDCCSHTVHVDWFNYAFPPAQLCISLVHLRCSCRPAAVLMKLLEILLHGIPRRPRRGPDQHAPAWMHSLWSILQEREHVEMLEEGQVACPNSH